MAAFRTSALAFAALSLCACASRHSVRVGDSLSSAPLSAENSHVADDGLNAEAPEHGLERKATLSENVPAEEVAATETDEEESADYADGEQPVKTAHPEPRELILARAALHRSPNPKNHLDLAMAVSERTSDLPWVMTIENRSSKPILLAALPSLIKLELHPPAEPADDPAAPTNDKSNLAKKSKPPEVVVCQSEAPPKKLSTEETITLPPGEIIFHALDPRTLCEKESSLQEGWEAKLSYGFPIQTRKIWRAGKLVEEEIEQKAPFVAERTPSPGDEVLPLKILSAEPFVLDATYPLSELTAKVKPKDSEGSDTDSPEGTPDEGDRPAGKGASVPPPPPPLKLEVANLGASKNPEGRLVEVRIRNTSSKSIKIFLRRELITYEVTGPTGTKTCSMQPADRAPDPSQFVTIAPGSSSYFPTRLAEACPPGTWDSPGNYSVSARMVSTASGSDYGLSAFTGIATTTTPARLTVIGDQSSKRPFLRIAPRHAAAPSSAVAPSSGSPDNSIAPSDAPRTNLLPKKDRSRTTSMKATRSSPARSFPRRIKENRLDSAASAQGLAASISSRS